MPRSHKMMEANSFLSHLRLRPNLVLARIKAESKQKGDDMSQKRGYRQYLIVIIALVVLAAVAYFVVLRQKKVGPVVAEPVVFEWEESVQGHFEEAPEAEPEGELRELAEEIQQIISEVVGEKVKTSHASDEKLVFVLNTIVVESDIDGIGKKLKEADYQDLSLSIDYNSLQAKKGDREFTFLFSRETTDIGQIEVFLK